MPTAFVTGVSGQDGSYLVERLLADGWTVHALIRPGDTRIDAQLARTPQIIGHVGDLADPEGLMALIETVAPEEIYHLGGLTSVARSWREPVLSAKLSGLGTAALLAAAWSVTERTGRAVRVLHASSSEIFGAPKEAPQTEATPLRPVSPYGAAKAYGHQLGQVYRGQGLHVVNVILYNHESPRRPVDFVTRKITRAAARIAAGLDQEVRLGNLAAVRDWGWAPDYVEAMIRAVRHDTPDDYVVATGEAHTVEDFVREAFLRAGLEDWASHVIVDEGLLRPADPARMVGNPSHAGNVLGWRPTVGFAELVRRMVDADRAAINS